MSLYLIKIGESLAEVLERAASAQPEQFAGYAANFDFWVAEFEHLVWVNDGYNDRLKAMQAAWRGYVAAQGGPHNLDDVRTPYQMALRTTRPKERIGIIARNRKALARLIKRALKLDLIDFPRHDELLERIGAE